jgi:hypothetical protein
MAEGVITRRVIFKSNIRDGLTSATAALTTQEIIAAGSTTDGMYWIDIPNEGPTQVYCDLTSDSTGWLLVYAGGDIQIGKNDNFWNGTSHPNQNFVFKGNTINTDVGRKIIGNVPFSQLRVTGTVWSSVSSVSYNASDKYPSPVIYASSITSTTFAQKKTSLTSWTLVSGTQGGLNWNASDNDGYTLGDFLLGIGPYGSNAYGDFQRAYIGGNVRGVGNFFGHRFFWPSETDNCGRSDGCTSSSYIRFHTVGWHYHRSSHSYADDALWFKQ